MAPVLQQIGQLLQSQQPVSLLDEQGEILGDANHLLSLPLTSPEGNATATIDSLATLSQAKWTHIAIDLHQMVARDTPSGLKSKRSDTVSYQLDTCILLAVRQKQSYTEYMAACKQLGITAVSLVDRRTVLAAIQSTGPAADVTWDTASVDATVLLARPDVGQHKQQEPSTQRKRAADFMDAAGSKRVRFPEESVPTATTKSGVSSLSKLIASHERSLQTTDSILRCSHFSFEYVSQMIKDIIKCEAQKSDKKESKSSRPTNSAAAPSADKNKSKSKSLPVKATPTVAAASKPKFIVVPASATSLINLYNVKTFLEEGRYLTPAEARNQTTEKLQKVVVTRKSVDGKTLSGPEVTFHVIDSVARLSPDDWNRVVAVFVQGVAWQFKGWKWGAPAEIFANIKGFHLKYDDTALDATVKGWNVTVLDINKTKRHLDVTAVHHFWRVLTGEK